MIKIKMPQEINTSRAVLINHLCNLLAMICLGILIGFGACAWMVDSDLSGQAIKMTFTTMIIPLSIIAIVLPKALVHIFRTFSRFK